MEREEKIRQLGFTVVSITSCEWQRNPASKIPYESHPVICSYHDIVEAVQKDEIFGFVKVDIHVPDRLKEKFSEFPPIFKNVEIPIDAVGEYMQEFCKLNNRTTGVKRSLISSMFGKGIVISTELLKKYLDMELIVTDIEWTLEYIPKTCFDWFEKEVIHNRRKADLDKDCKILGETSKLMGNAFYGGTGMDKSKHTSLKFCDEEKIHGHIRHPLFKTLEERNDDIYEVEKSKKRAYLDSPVQIMIAVYSYAKLLLISFWEFLNKYLDNELYELLETDTDSLYVAFARETIDECVKPELREEWNQVKWNFFLD